VSKTDYVEEKILPGGSWERTYHGRAVNDAIKEMQPEIRDAKQELSKQDVWVTRLKNGQLVKRNVKELEKLERQGQLAASKERFAGARWGGPGRKPCLVCGGDIGRQRYVPGLGWFCKKGCIRESEALVGNLAV
jgi:hypothetical protein